MVLVLLLGTAVALRLPQLGEPADNYDEGVYLESFLLMARGFLPFREISTSQGPLHLYAQFPFFVLFGQTIEAARAASVISSLLALGGVWWIGRQLAGRWAGLGGSLLLLVSPTYLRFSRQAMADIPALAPAALAIGAALAYRRHGRPSLLMAAAFLMALGILMKPIVLPAVIPVILLVWRPSRAGWRDVGALLTVLAATVGAVLLVLGPMLVLDQVLGFRAEARAAYGWSLARNGGVLTDRLGQEQLGFFALGLLGLGLAVVRRECAVLIVALWAGGSLALLLGHSPLRYHHMVILLPPVAILGGVAIASVPALYYERRMARILGGVALVTVVLYGVGLPELIRRDRLLLDNIDTAGAGSNRIDDVVSAAERIQRLTMFDDVIVTDEPYVAFLANRRVPPELVDPSEARLRSGDLTDDEVVALAAAYHPKVVVLWSGRFATLPGFLAWVAAEYRQEKGFGTDDSGQPRVILRARAR